MDEVAALLAEAQRLLAEGQTGALRTTLIEALDVIDGGPWPPGARIVCRNHLTLIAS